jgi:hypothetical protein
MEMTNVLELIEWAEKEPNRARRVVLFSTVLIYIFITLALMVSSLFGLAIDTFAPFYYSFSTVAGTAIAFYTGFKAKEKEG